MLFSSRGNPLLNPSFKSLNNYGDDFLSPVRCVHLWTRQTHGSTEILGLNFRHFTALREGGTLICIFSLQ